MVSFTCSQRLNQGDVNGDTALHLCAQMNQTECMKLLLRVQPDLVNYENQQGLTALEMARERHAELCVEMVGYILICGYALLAIGLPSSLILFYFSSAEQRYQWQV